MTAGRRVPQISCVMSGPRPLSQLIAPVALLCASGVWSAAATAQDAAAPGEEPLDIYAPVPAERRADFMVGTHVGLLIGSARGFPSDFDKVGVDEFEADTGTVATFGSSFWIGGALQDWFTFGLGGLAVALSGNDLETSGGAFFVRLEFFPLYPLGGSLRDLGLAASFGTGGVSIERDGKEQADGAGVSVVGASAFWELLRWHGLAFGPAVDYTFMTMRSIDVHLAQVGLRTAWYSGP